MIIQNQMEKLTENTGYLLEIEPSSPAQTFWGVNLNLFLNIII